MYGNTSYYGNNYCVTDVFPYYEYVLYINDWGTWVPTSYLQLLYDRKSFHNNLTTCLLPPCVQEQLFVPSFVVFDNSISWVSPMNDEELFQNINWPLNRLERTDSCLIYYSLLWPVDEKVLSIKLLHTTMAASTSIPQFVQNTYPADRLKYPDESL